MIRFTVILFSMLAATPVLAGTTTIDLATNDVVAHSAGGALGNFYTISLLLPNGLSAGDVSGAVLELYVDVWAEAINGWTNDTPLLEVYALSAAFTGTLDRANFITPSSMVRPVRVGEAQRVRIDVTGLVKTMLDEPGANHGLVIGSFRGSQEGRFTVRTDKLPNGVPARLTILSD